jgi:hypothetical protein
MRLKRAALSNGRKASSPGTGRRIACTASQCGVN